MTYRLSSWHRFPFLGFPLLAALTACGGDDPKEKPKTDPTTGERPVEAACDDAKDNDSDGFTDCDDLDCRSVGGACELAPALDRTVASTVWEAAQFLFTGSDPVQKDVDAKSFERRRIAILRGRVVDVDGEPLRDVRVAVKGHDEYGYTLSRADGAFDLAVNGGSRLVIDFQKTGFLRVQRSMQPGWQRYEHAGEVGLLKRSEKGTAVSSGADVAQLAAGETAEDDGGSRQPLVIFQPGTAAVALMPDGDEVPLEKLTVRLTEYPLEKPTFQTLVSGPRFSPGSLPVASAFNYGIEFSVDEAEELGAKQVQFSKPRFRSEGGGRAGRARW
jgi:hypothetical protein